MMIDQRRLPLLPMLGEKYPALVQFTLWARYSPDIGRQMNYILPRWTRLRTLTVPHLPEESFRAIAGLPHLLELTLTKANSKFGDTFSSMSGQPAFPALRRLSIMADTPTLCVNLLRATTNCPLEEFTFWLYEESTSDWRNLFSALAESCNKATLKEIHVEDLAISHGSGAPSTLATDQLRPLLSFTDLTRVHLSTRHEFTIDSALLREMAAAWPHLQHLDIGAIEIYQPSEQRPPFTLQGLAPLAEFCPDLEDLTVCVDATHFCFNHINLGSCPSDSRVEFLVVHRSPITQSSVPWVAAYLSGVFPRLCKIGWANSNGSEEDEEWLAYPKRWLEVMNHLAAYRHTRGHKQDDLY
ncbi:hypothetical protein BD779DRAFT_530312 [Infundibulicybe gibba]|nr:hypothetical protein BD779DRAFT_530312 [Infundibulicybe gibba]